MRTTFLLLTLLLGACSNDGCRGSGDSDEAQPRSVAIDATATLHIPPDTAAISITFGAINLDLAVAHEQVERDRGAFLARIADRDARVERGLTQYSPYRPSGATLERYRATDTVVVHTERLADIPQIIRLASSGVTAVRVEHYVSDLVQHRATLREMAIGAAREKASDLADGFDVELGDVLTIHEGGATRHTYFEGNVDNRFARVETSDGEVPPPGAIPLRVTLQVTFELET